MLKKLIVLAMALFIIACGKQQSVSESTEMTVTDITTTAADYVGKPVTVTGTVVHVCRVSGKKLFIVGDDPQQRFKVTAGADMGTFDMALEGSQIKVSGVLKVEKMAAMMQEGGQMGAEHKGHDQAEHAEMAEPKEGAECAEDANAVYSLECSALQEI